MDAEGLIGRVVSGLLGSGETVSWHSHHRHILRVCLKDVRLHPDFVPVPLLKQIATCLDTHFLLRCLRFDLCLSLSASVLPSVLLSLATHLPI